MDFIIDNWLTVLGQLLLQSPHIIVNAVGLAISVAKYARHPRISVLAIAGFAALLLLSLASPLTFLFTFYQMGRGGSVQTVTYVNAAVGLVLTLISAAAHGLLIAAIWKDRG